MPPQECHFSGSEATLRSEDSPSCCSQSALRKMGENRRTIRIPLEPHSVVIFPDELPVGDLDYNDIIDILRSVLAPLKLWRSCAVEYHRQGFRVEFDQVLSEIIDSLADPCKHCNAMKLHGRCSKSQTRHEFSTKTATKESTFFPSSQMSRRFTGRGSITRKGWPTYSTR